MNVHKLVLVLKKTGTIVAKINYLKKIYITTLMAPSYSAEKNDKIIITGKTFANQNHRVLAPNGI